ASATFTLKYLHGMARDDRPLGHTKDLAGSRNEHVVNTRRTVICQDAAKPGTSFEIDRSLLALGLRSSIMVPLISKGRVVGTLGLRSKSPGAFGDREQDILEKLAIQIAPAVENADLYLKLQNRIQEQAVVDDVASVITATLDIDQVYERFGMALRTLVDFDRLNINIIDYNAGNLIIKYVTGPTIGVGQAGDTIPLPRTLTEHILVTGRTLCRAEIQPENSFSSELGQLVAGLRSSIAVPLQVKGRVIGILGLRSHQVGAYGPHQQAILERLANQIAPAIENAQIYERAKEEMALADDVAKIVTSTLDVNEVYEKFAQGVKKLVPFDRITINIIDSVTGTRVIKYLSGLAEPGVMVGDRAPLADTPTQQLMMAGQPIIQNDILSETEFPANPRFVSLGLRSRIGVPLLSRGQAIGGLFLHSLQPGIYEPSHAAILERLARHIAPAIENAQIYERAKEEMALVDEVAKIMTSTLKIDQVYDKFVQGLMRLVGFDRMAINIIDEENGVFESRHLFGEVCGGIPSAATIPLENTQTQTLLATGKSLIRPDITQEKGFAHDHIHIASGLRASIIIPLISQGRVIGTIGLRSRQVGAYGTREQAILERLANQIAPAVENARLYEQQMQAEQVAKESERSYRELYQDAPIAYYSVGVDGNIRRCNQRTLDLLGYSASEMVGMSVFELYPNIPQGKAKAREIFQRFLAGQPSFDEQVQMQKKDGTPVWINLTVNLLRDSVSGEVVESRAIAVDITERKRLEEQVLQSQKMEMVGQLAGGVAHDFNNLLAAIMGYSQIALNKSLGGENISGYVEETLKAAERASSLTNQLLAFSRRQVVEPQVLNLNDVILDLHQMLRRLIG
ncbi:MAG: GAF domain-containing protein, partial [Dehalococcoidia bacterium]